MEPVSFSKFHLNNILINFNFFNVGDSGGGLFLGDPNNHSSERVVIGIVSYGALAGCELGYPAAFARVTSFIPWIDRHIAAQD